GNHLADLRDGDTVEVGQGYETGRGEAGRVYRYIGANQDGVDLARENYADATRWLRVEKLKVSILVAGQSWALVAPDGKAYILALNEDGALVVSASTINAVAVAASIAVSFGGVGAGVAVAGAGAVAQNVIFSKTNSFIQDSIVVSKVDVTVSAA